MSYFSDNVRNNYERIKNTYGGIKLLCVCGRSDISEQEEENVLTSCLENHKEYAIYDGLVIETFPAQYHVFVGPDHYEIVHDDLSKHGFTVNNCHN